MCEIGCSIRFCSICFCYLFILLIHSVNGRGRMIEPPMRSSMWRFYPWSINPDVKKNTDDGGLNCGGFWRLHGINKGKCGICGDPFDAIQKQNEAGGKFYSGIIVRQYFHGDGYINVTIDVSSNIKGYFEFNICPLKGVNGTLTRKCLDKYPLLIKGNGLRYVPIADGKHNLKVKIPPNLFCKHCVLRWKWIGGNNWGECSDGYGGLGCGDQTEYYNCADISILSAYDRPNRKQLRKRTTAKPITVIPEISQPKPTAPMTSRLQTDFIPRVVPERPMVDIPKQEVKYTISQVAKTDFKEAGGIVIRPEKMLRKYVPDSKQMGTTKITRRVGETIENPAFGFRWTPEKERTVLSDESYSMMKKRKQKDIEKSSIFYETQNSKNIKLLKDDRTIVKDDRRGGQVMNIQSNLKQAKPIEAKFEKINDVPNINMDTRFNEQTNDVSNVEPINFMDFSKIDINFGAENRQPDLTLVSEKMTRPESKVKKENLTPPPPKGLSIRNPWKYPQSDNNLAIVTESRNENIMPVTISPQRVTTPARALPPPTLPPPSLDVKEQVHLMGNAVQQENDLLNRNKMMDPQILEANNNINSQLNANPTEKPWPYMDSFITTPSTKNDWSMQNTWLPFLAMEIADGVMPANKVATSINSKQFDVTDVRQRGGSISSITGIDNSKRIKGVKHFDEIIDPDTVTPPSNLNKAPRPNPATRAPMKRATKVLPERDVNMVMSKTYTIYSAPQRSFTTKATTQPPQPKIQAPSAVALSQNEAVLSQNEAPSLQQKDSFIRDIVLDSSAIQKQEGQASFQNLPQSGRLNLFPRDMPMGKSDSSMSSLSQLTVISV